MSLKDKILDSKDLSVAVVTMPEWGTDVTVKALTGTQRDIFEKKIKDGQITNLRAWFAAQCIVDEDGTRVFTDADIAKLSGKSGAALDRILDKVLEISGIKQSPKELEKN